MASSTTDGAYFDWLYSHVARRTPDSRSSLLLLCERLHMTEFWWSDPMDANRAEDGVTLREHFRLETGVRLRDRSPCSVLEMMVALAQRAADIADGTELTGSARVWMRTMLDNADLLCYTDDVLASSEDALDEVDQRVETVLARAYEADGSGGLFPLSDPPRDLRDVELAYQMMWFITENEDPYD